MPSTDQRPAEILLVEDSPTDVLITREALRNAKVLVSLSVVSDGVEALQFLRREGQFVDAPRPDIILLDLNLPRKDGREVLAEVKADPDLRLIPIVVLTSSRAEEDVVRSYGLYVNCYIVKPIDFHQFTSVVQTMESFWLQVVTLPSLPA